MRTHRFLIRQVRCRHGVCDIRVCGRRIEARAPSLAQRARERVIDGRGLCALPGLINAHDHLSLNLLPPLGAPPYTNIYAFADDVYRPEEPPLEPLQGRTQVRDRLLWGAYKNLISGVTTVAHHDPFTRRVFHRGFPVKVVRRYGWSHSLRFGPDPARAYRASRGAPFIIHLAEGVDEVVAGEVARLDTLGALGPNTVLIHAIAVDAAQRRRIADAHSSVVWCPHSNRRLYDAVAPIDAYQAAGVPVSLGTDATMSGAPTLLDEARDALATGLASPDQILAMVTDHAATIFDLEATRTALAPGAAADLLLLPEAGDSLGDALLAASPADLALVTVDGQARLAHPPIAEQLDLGPPNAVIDGAPKVIYGDLAGLRRRLLRAAGEKALSTSPLWSRITTPT